MNGRRSGSPQILCANNVLIMVPRFLKTSDIVKQQAPVGRLLSRHSTRLLHVKPAGAQRHSSLFSALQCNTDAELRQAAQQFMRQSSFRPRQLTNTSSANLTCMYRQLACATSCTDRSLLCQQWLTRCLCCLYYTGECDVVMIQSTVFDKDKRPTKRAIATSAFDGSPVPSMACQPSLNVLVYRPVRLVVGPIP